MRPPRGLFYIVGFFGSTVMNGSAPWFKVQFSLPTHMFGSPFFPKASLNEEVYRNKDNPTRVTMTKKTPKSSLSTNLLPLATCLSLFLS
jgi:TctA family transporter